MAMKAREYVGVFFSFFYVYCHKISFTEMEIKLPSLAALKVAILKTFNPAGEKNFVKITTLSFQCSILSSSHFKHVLTWIPAWMNDYICYKVWNEITYTFPNFNGCIESLEPILGRKHVYNCHQRCHVTADGLAPLGARVLGHLNEQWRLSSGAVLIHRAISKWRMSYCH